MKIRAAGLLPLAVAVLVSTQPASGGTGPATIRITDVQAQVKDIGGSGGGTRQLISVRLYNRSVTPRSIGRGELVCTFVDAKNRLCTGAYSLPKGQLVVSGLISTRLLYEMAIVGGTGLYDNARGSLTVTATAFNPRHELLFFRLSG